jgi:hypothetical protein
MFDITFPGIAGRAPRYRPEGLARALKRMQTIIAAELVLAPLTVADADTMFGVLSDPQIYRYLDYGPPPSVEHLRDVDTKLEARNSPDGSQLWLNWVVHQRGAEPMGYVQATVFHLEPLGSRTCYPASTGVVATRAWQRMP